MNDFRNIWLPLSGRFYKVAFYLLESESDAEDALEYLKKPMVNCFACMKVNSLEEAKKAVLDRAKDKELYFAIVLKENGKVIGEIDAMPENAVDID